MSLKSKVDKDVLIDLTSKGYSDSYIGKLFNVGSSAVASQRRKLGIIKTQKEQNISHSRQYDYYNIFEDNDLMAALIGTLLGDGWLTKSGKGSKSYRGGISHSTKQYCYLEYKKQLLSAIITNSGITSKLNKEQTLNGKKIAENTSCNITFKASPYLKELHSILYRNGKKVITDKLLEHFDVLSLALFYFDDGHKSINKSGLVYYRIANYDLDLKSRLKFQSFLLEKFNLNCKVYANCFEFFNKEGIKFINLIKEYAPECVQYKL